MTSSSNNPDLELQAYMQAMGQAMREHIESNPGLLQSLNQRLQSNFPRPAGRVSRTTTTTQEPSYMETISCHQVTWLVDDIAVDGAILIFNPRSGQLFLKFIDATKPPAGEVAKLVHSLPSGEQPKQIIVSKRMLIDPLVENFPNTAIKASEVERPFRALLKNEKFRELITTDQPHHVLFVFKIYDDWLKSNSSYTAFSRMILVLRALDVSYEEAKRVLERAETHEPEHHIWLWPAALSSFEWMKVEIALRDLILSDYAHKNNVVDVPISDFTQTEIRDIILFGACAEITPH
ncbi:hypothetical protein M0R45_035103 [Rubus argutus]|uniref:PRP8 domain-containing protein n=1 Tax=Rubus argutus TaxID=59490 RepID=A0AAW1VWJ0_RUBAR